MTTFNSAAIKRSIRIDAIGLGIPAGAAEVFADRAVRAAEKSLRSKKLITQRDLSRTLAKELRVYHADLAYVYKNRDTII